MRDILVSEQDAAGHMDENIMRPAAQLRPIETRKAAP
jgi:hypothetical protein